MNSKIQNTKYQIQNKGITLVALVITIIVLLILAGVAINMAINSNGLFGKANEAATSWNTAVGKDEQDINRLMEILNNSGKQENHDYVKDGDKITCNHCDEEYTIGVSTIDYEFDLPENDVILTAEKSGAEDDQIIFEAESMETTYTDITWVVLGVSDEDGDGTKESLLITSSVPVGEIAFRIPEAYLYGPEELERICRELYSNEKVTARSIVFEDIANALDYEVASGFYINKECNFIKTDNSNLTLSDIDVWEKIIENGTLTPDGINTPEALGKIKIEGDMIRIIEERGNFKLLDVVSNEYPLEFSESTLIFIAGRESWIGSRMATAVGMESDSGDYFYSGLGLSECYQAMFGSFNSMFESMSSSQLNNQRVVAHPIRPVVPIQTEYKEPQEKCEVHSYKRDRQTITCENCDLKYTIGLTTVNYNFNLPINDIVITSEKSGEDENQIIYEVDSEDTTYSDVEWVVLGIEDEDKDGKNESLLITSTIPVGLVKFKEDEGFFNGASELNRVCDELYSTDTGKARNMNVIDVFNAFGITNATGTFIYGPEEKSIEVPLGTTLADIEEQGLISNVPEQLKEKLAGDFLLKFFVDGFELDYDGLIEPIDCSNSDLKYAGLMINAGRDREGEKFVAGSTLASSMVTHYRLRI